MEHNGEATSEVQNASSDAQIKPNTELKKLLFFKVYKRRWFVLLVLCLLNCSNAMVSERRDLTVNDRVIQLLFHTVVLSVFMTETKMFRLFRL